MHGIYYLTLMKQKLIKWITSFKSYLQSNHESKVTLTMQVQVNFPSNFAFLAGRTLNGASNPLPPFGYACICGRSLPAVSTLKTSYGNKLKLESDSRITVTQDVKPMFLKRITHIQSHCSYQEEYNDFIIIYLYIVNYFILYVDLGIPISELSQTEKDEYCMASLECGGNGERLVKGYKLPVKRKQGKVWRPL